MAGDLDAGRDPRSLVLRNTGLLYVLQISNYLLPLVSLPILVRRLGVDGYSTVAFGLSAVLLVTLIADLGFSFSATYRIARAESDTEVRQIHTSVLAAKAVLSALGALAIALIPWVFSDFNDQRLFFAIISLGVIGNAMQPIWLFQGIQRMGGITVYTLCARVAYVVGVVLLIRGPDDLILVAVLYVMSTWIGGVLGSILARRGGYHLQWDGWANTVSGARASLPFLWARLAATSATSGTVFLLGVLGNNEQLVMFSVCEQIYRALQQLASPLVQSIFPYMAKQLDFGLLRRAILTVVVACFVGVVVAFSAGTWFLETVFGSDFGDSYAVLVVLAVAFAFYWPAMLVGLGGLGALGQLRVSNFSTIAGGLAHLVALFVLAGTGNLTALTAATSVAVMEFLVLIVQVAWLKRALTVHHARSVA